MQDIRRLTSQSARAFNTVHVLVYTNCSYTMMAKPMKSLELHNPMIQCLIKTDSTQDEMPSYSLKIQSLCQY